MSPWGGQSTGRARWCWLLGRGPAGMWGRQLGQPRQTGTYLPASIMALGPGATSAMIAADLLAAPGTPLLLPLLTRKEARRKSWL